VRSKCGCPPGWIQKGSGCGPSSIRGWRNRTNRRRITSRAELEALALLSGFPAYAKRPTRELARQRNLLVAALAGEVLVAHARPGSGTWCLAQEVLGWGKRVYTFDDNPKNRHRLEIGVSIYGLTQGV
jgi:predicted Rossmann fold nucleotide-binding protein DprA/Smf involved in DNA uptake